MGDISTTSPRISSTRSVGLRIPTSAIRWYSSRVKSRRAGATSTAIRVLLARRIHAGGSFPRSPPARRGGAQLGERRLGLWRGCHAELVSQELLAPRVRPHGFRAVPRGRQRAHQALPARLAERLQLDDLAGELGGQRVLAVRGSRRGQTLEGADARLAEAGPRALDPLAVHAPQERAGGDRRGDVG